jgi:hypothetical protein
VLRTFVVLVLLMPCAAHAQRERDVAREVHRAGRYSDRLPLAGDRAQGDPWTGPGGGSSSSGSSGPPPSAEPAAPAAASAGLSWVIAVIAIVLLIALFVAVLVSIRPRERITTHAAKKLEPPAIARAPAAAPLGDPDALAAAGLFAEAIAAALMQGLLAVGWRPEGNGRSRTAREILASVPHDDGTLASLVELEERIAFGGDDATPASWERARSLWVALTQRGAR